MTHSFPTRCSSDLEFLDYWFGDGITSTVWQYFFVLGQTRPEVLGAFLCQPGISADAKCAVSKALAQIGVHFPSRREEVVRIRSEEHTSELQSLMRISYAVYCLKKNTKTSPT